MKRVLTFMGMVLMLSQAVAAAPLFMFELGEHPQIRWMQGVMYSVVNTIVTEEAHDTFAVLGCPKAAVPMSMLGFIKKPRIGLSVVYLTDASDVNGLADATQKRIHKAGLTASEVMISGEGGLFGPNKDELVVKIKDTANVLSALRKELLAVIDPALVNNRFPFVPHVSFGKLRMDAVVHFVARVAGVRADNPEVRFMVDRINTRLGEAIMMMPTQNRTTLAIPIKVVNLYDSDHRSVRAIVLK